MQYHTPTAGSWCTSLYTLDFRLLAGARLLISRLCCAALLVISLSFEDANAIKIRHDTEDQKYLDLGEKYSASVAYLGRNSCASTLIDPNWLVTAAHCVKGREQVLLSVQHMDKVYRVDKVVVHPNYKTADEYDIALIQLREPIADGKPAKLYQRDDEEGKPVVFVGRGEFGNGQIGVIEHDGKQRGATNTIIGTSDYLIEFKFDRPEEATELEGISGGGDSGGPAFITLDSQLYIAGVSSFQARRGHEKGTYGVSEYYTRVSKNIAWLEDAMENTTAPASNLPDHPLITAIKNDNIADFNRAISREVIKNEAIISEAFLQTIMLDRLTMAEKLIEHGADLKSLTVNDLSLPELAIMGEHGAYLEMLVLKLRHLRDIHPKESKILPLLFAVLDDSSQALEAVEILLDQGANINAQTPNGDTAVIKACWRLDNLDLVKLLVERGADINIPNNNGDTPLMDTAYLGKNDILGFLLENGADTKIKNNTGHTALGLALRRKNVKGAGMLLFHKLRSTLKSF